MAHYDPLHQNHSLQLIKDNDICRGKHTIYTNLQTFYSP